MSICYLNGDYLPLAEARVSPMDRSFLFGDGAYEVIPVYSRKPFRLAEHLRRLERTLAAIRLPDPHTAGEWAAKVGEIVARNEPADQGVYLHVSRGADVKRNQAFPSPAVPPTVFLMSEPLSTPGEHERETGVGAVSAADFRWLRCDLKTVSLLANCLLRQIAVDHGCAETILFRDGFLTEGAASSIFVVKDGVLRVPPNSHLMLPGVTYDVVLELAARHGLPHEVREILEAEVRDADELLIASSPKEVLPVTTLDGRPVGDGKPGPVGRRLHALYQEFKDTVMRSG
ncbi:D-amino acid aminotransferase [Thauera sinica]|uniref:D-amino acid aminotransferase n=1 Tax=Thauera sinica TaxID=2665146 RepID=A0ABW1ASC8_9RHOO|nr:D-amino acid aminotransferase [Thauera sp. K11]ATE62164.1 D-amino acid aminotransferase [Thauera sp. K11]